MENNPELKLMAMQLALSARKNGLTRNMTILKAAKKIYEFLSEGRDGTLRVRAMQLAIDAGFLDVAVVKVAKEIYKFSIK
jgi:hypothetical protein